jgi:hypothetical protein
MNREDIIRLAIECQIVPTGTRIYINALERFAALVAAAEREACAQVCDAAERENAERYRWLRDNNASFSWNPSRYNQETVSGFAAFGTGYCGFEFEDAVDKARGTT